MLYASRYAQKLGLSGNDEKRIESALLAYGLPVSCDFTKQEIFESLLTDKKRRGDKITLVLPVKIGKCKLVKTDIEKFKETF